MDFIKNQFIKIFFASPGVMVITIAQLHSTNAELRFCRSSSPARSMSEIRDGEPL